VRLAMIDGVIYASEQAKISVYDRGFLYGDSVFETVRTYAGKTFALDEHMRRLEKSAAALAIALPVPAAELAEETLRAIREAGNAESSARVMVTRGVGPMGLDPAAALAPCRVILVEPLHLPADEAYRRGVSARCVQTVRASDAAHSAKLANYLASVLAVRDAKAAGADEALVVNREGRVVEGTTANVFAVIGGRVVTPALDAGILDGITRAAVIELARAEGMTVELSALTPQELGAADEVFLTSTIREILPVREVDGRAIAAPGPVTRRLHAAFRKRVGAAPPPYLP
jgi:branched-chain amino acid aminotransferase